ncbi:hypothetical protein EW026_g7332 [Hermanssonia centrifuga]|uniref:Uncharacterized protein n=1 Tax=Hermanssonia centrifuga TaxID=98765 RepID=A0A4V3X9G1_9APHY|nr:hypothetical protein EW026_g7332 [Hermanssonia centrifuga]
MYTTYSFLTPWFIPIAFAILLTLALSSFSNASGVARQLAVDFMSGVLKVIRTIVMAAALSAFVVSGCMAILLTAILVINVWLILAGPRFPVVVRSIALHALKPRNPLDPEILLSYAGLVPLLSSWFCPEKVSKYPTDKFIHLECEVTQKTHTIALQAGQLMRQSRCIQLQVAASRKREGVVARSRHRLVACKISGRRLRALVKQNILRLLEEKERRCLNDLTRDQEVCELHDMNIDLHAQHDELKMIHTDREVAHQEEVVALVDENGMLAIKLQEVEDHAEQQAEKVDRLEIDLHSAHLAMHAVTGQLQDVLTTRDEEHDTLLRCHEDLQTDYSFATTHISSLKTDLSDAHEDLASLQLTYDSTTSAAHYTQQILEGDLADAQGLIVSLEADLVERDNAFGRLESSYLNLQELQLELTDELECTKIELVEVKEQADSELRTQLAGQQENHVLSLGQMQAQLDANELKLQASEAQTASLELRISTLQAELSSEQSAHKASEADRIQLKKAIEDLETRKAEYKSICKVLKAEKESLAEKLTCANTEKDRFEGELYDQVELTWKAESALAKEKEFCTTIQSVCNQEVKASKESEKELKISQQAFVGKLRDLEAKLEVQRMAYEVQEKSHTQSLAEARSEIKELRRARIQDAHQYEDICASSNRSGSDVVDARLQSANTLITNQRAQIVDLEQSLELLMDDKNNGKAVLRAELDEETATRKRVEHALHLLRASMFHGNDSEAGSCPPTPSLVYSPGSSSGSASPLLETPLLTPITEGSLTSSMACVPLDLVDSPTFRNISAAPSGIGLGLTF